MTTATNMYLYHLTLQKATAILKCVSGNFSAPKAQEIIVSRGRVLELLRPDDNNRLVSVVSHDVFGNIRSIHPFRLTGGTRDYLVVGSDSGRIVVLKFDEKANRFQKVHEETFGKSGCRRIVPGQYLAVDSKGRAVMIGAIEKQKLVYILNRDAAAKLTISSPLEAHKSHTILFDMCALDVDFENPQFCCLEVDYQADDGVAPPKKLVTYELDLGLNHVVRKYTVPAPHTANMLIPVPGGDNAPGGLLVFSENFITYKNHGYPDVVRRIPQRKDFYDSRRGLLIVSCAPHQQKSMFFFLVQSELGDLYKVDVKFQGDEVTDLKISYFDTVPVSSSATVMKNGCLFVAAETGDHYLYQFHSMGDDDAEMLEMADDGETPLFRPHHLKNLIPVDRLDNLAPLLDSGVTEVAASEGGGQQIYTLSGANTDSTIRLVKHGLAVTEMAVSPLEAIPNGIWTVKTNSNDPFDTFIVVSYANATMVLSIGETVEQISDAESGFLGENATLLVALLGENSIIQVHPTGIRFIRGKDMRIEWKVPQGRTIVCAAANTRQVVVALTGGDLLYFELDDVGQLVEVGKKELGNEITCVDIAPIPEGRQRARFLAVGDNSNTCRIFSLYPDEDFERLSVQTLSSVPKSVCLLTVPSSILESSSSSSFSTDSINGPTVSANDDLYLSIGLTDGVLLRTVVDPLTGQIADTRRRFLGSRPVQLFKIRMGDQVSMLAKSTRCWLCYNHQSKFFMTPLSYVPLQSATSFCSEQCPNGVVGYLDATLRIFTIDRLGDTFNQVSQKVRYTPRKLLLIPHTNHAVAVESTLGMLSEVHDHEEIAQLAAPIEEEMMKHKQADSDDEEEEDEEDYKEKAKGMAKQKRTEFKNGRPVWSSCLRVVDTVSQRTISLLEMEKGEGCFCVCLCVFASRPEIQFIVAGCAVGFDPNTRSSESAWVKVYYYNPENGMLSLLHKTQVEEVPTALEPFQGRLLMGMGKVLRMYELGKKKLLRKCENAQFPLCVKTIKTKGSRIYVGDLGQSIHFCSYKFADNTIDIFADDFIPRWSTALEVLDYDTVVGGDKFGNIFVLRLKKEISDEVEHDKTGNKTIFERGHLNGAPHKLEGAISFHVGEVITSLHKTSLVPGGSEVILYTTILGGIGAFLPFSSRDDIDFFQHLEMHLRSEFPPLCGRDHLSFRSAYVPVKDVIDGDLCEQFAMLDAMKQKKVSLELDRRNPSEVMKKLEDIRHMIL